jgi:2-hydroxycyclohexanecarboxyl-CoA dehydrogenase
MDRLKDKVAVVTGSGRGVGRGVALVLGAEGARVVVASRTKRTVDEVAGIIGQRGGTAIGITCDVSERDQVFSLVDKAVDAFGTVDILVNNAQGFGSKEHPAPTPLINHVQDSDEGEWDYTLRTGLWATMWGMKAVFPLMKDRGGKIINFGSSGGQKGNAGSAPYNATKEAIRSLSRTAAREWGQYGINIHVINPTVHSDALQAYFDKSDDLESAHAKELAAPPLGRYGQPEDIGRLVVFLAGGEADHMTGGTFMMDSGLYIAP